MIQNGTYLKVIDNSGAKDICCIKVSKGYKKRYSFVGDIIVVSIKNLRNKRRLTSKVKKGDVTRALIIRTRSVLRSSTNSKNNEHLSFLDNCAILLTKQNKLVGTRIFGGLPKFFKYTRFYKLVAVCAGSIK